MSTRLHRTRSFRGLVVALLVLATPAAVIEAQQPPDVAGLSLEELMALEVDVVYGASRFQQKIDDAPASVVVISGEQIRLHGYRTLGDVLASTPGIIVTSDRNYSYLGVRGLARPGDYNSRVLILVNGHRLNDNIYDQGMVGTEFPIDLTLIDRVEVIRGPNSSLYGTSAFLAVVNILTKAPRSLPTLGVVIGGGSLGTKDGQVTLSHASQAGPSILLSASRYESEGIRSWSGLDAAGAPLGPDADRDTATRLYATLAFRGLTIDAVRGERQKHVPTGSYGTIFGDPRFVTTDTRQYVNAEYQRPLKGFTVTARGYADSYRYDGRYPYDDGTGGSYINIDRADGSWWGAEVRATSPPGRVHHFSFGAEYVHHVRQDQFNANEAGPTVLDDRRRSSDWGVYAQDHYVALPQLAIDASLRYDRHGTQDGTTSPRLALIYSPEARTTLKALYGRVFRYPNAYESYYADGESQKTNPALTPESVNTYEVNVARRIASGVRLVAGAFRSEFTDVIDLRLDPSDGLLFYDNAQRLATHGLELEAEAKDSSGTTGARLAYSMHWTTNRDTGAQLWNAPRHVLKLSASRMVAPAGLAVAADLQFLSPRLAISGTKTDAVWLATATVTKKQIVRGLDLAASVYNLFNQHFDDPASAAHSPDIVRQDGRTARVTLTYRLQ